MTSSNRRPSFARRIIILLNSNTSAVHIFWKSVTITNAIWQSILSWTRDVFKMPVFSLKALFSGTPGCRSRAFHAGYMIVSRRTDLRWLISTRTRYALLFLEHLWISRTSRSALEFIITLSFITRAMESCISTGTWHIVKILRLLRDEYLLVVLSADAKTEKTSFPAAHGCARFANVKIWR